MIVLLTFELRQGNHVSFLLWNLICILIEHHNLSHLSIKVGNILVVLSLAQYH